MAQYKCIFCGKPSEAPLDEHVETHHTRYDVHRILTAIISSMAELHGGVVPAAISDAQQDNLKRLRERAKKMEVGTRF